MLTHVLLLALTISDPAAIRPYGHTAARPYGYYKPRVEVWTSKGDNPFFRGDGARVYMRADQDAYVTLFRVDTDGRVRVVYPRAPWEDNFVRGGQEFEVESYSSRSAFTVDDDPGVGYLFAVASADPFVYDAIETGDHWDYRVIADGRVRGDPYVALTDLAGRIVPANDSDWDYDMVPYYVERHYDYPRFLCYDCHAYASYAYWDPYAYSCVRFRIVVFDDPYYYPYRYYGGTRVVFTRPLRPQPRFIFRDRTSGDNSGFLSRERERPVNDNQRRGVRGADLGGRGVIAPPQRPPAVRPGDDGRRDRPDQPDRPDRPRPDRPDHPDHPDRPDHPDHPDHPDRPDRRDPPGRSDDQGRREQIQRQDRPRFDRPSDADRPVERKDRPRVDRPSDDGQREARPEPRPAPRNDPPRAEPRAAPRNEPRSAPPRAEPRRDSAPKDKPQPELRRRRP